MRLAGLDVGDKTIGVALSDLLGWTAQGLEVIRRTSLARDLERLRQLAAQHEVSRWVVGLPRNMNGTYGPRAELARAFAADLAAATGLPVELWDERLTTAQAQRALIAGDVRRDRRRAVVDRLAAQLILQGYMDAHRARDGET